MKGLEHNQPFFAATVTCTQAAFAELVQRGGAAESVPAVEALHRRARASVFKDIVVGFCFIAARKTAGSEGGNRGYP